ncbi:diguanylate cyclase domain-containing protein [uncultured Hyphomonas sp.]|uniref:diguanylate cyclase domain-containing protein n=1 Tax=uncultured Hyphomonas sp. TaxID=225298 RepID=UPI002AAA8CD6|nr:diguanylate cyclase [uncultured Hyphomonas sp.]
MVSKAFRLQDAAARKPDAIQLHVLWRRYVVALGLILGFIFVSHVVSMAELRRATEDASSINLSGRQRMLLQRITHAAHDYSISPNDALRSDLEAHLALFESSHDTLNAISSEDNLLSTLYTQGSPSLNSMSSRMMENARKVLASPGTSAELVEALETDARGALANRLDGAVSAFEAAAEHRSTQLKNIEAVSLLVAALTVIGEILLIFWPAHKAITNAFSQLRAKQVTTEATLARLSNFAELASDLFWETDANGLIIYAEGKFLDRLRGGRSNIVGCQYTDIIQLDDENLTKILSAIESLGRYSGAHGTFTDTDGCTYNIEISGMPRYDTDGNVVGYLGTADDITANVQEKEQVIQMANSDPLTGLANMRRFEQELPGIIAHASPASPAYLLALDLDGFKAVNDTFGHGAGDELLKHVASQMDSMTREDDLLVRIGGDEFVIVCQNVSSPNAIECMAEDLNQALSTPLVLSTGHKVRVSASIGIACAPFDAKDKPSLRRAADTALYASKRNGRNQTRFFQNLTPDTLHAIAS